MTFREALAEQRWDDHRYYHHSRINQSLHLVSAVSFMCAYVLLFVDPAIATLVGWMFAMPSRQIGHFFFEPRGYDVANQATHEFKESVKVGYNLRRKVVLHIDVAAVTAPAGDRSDAVRNLPSPRRLVRIRPTRVADVADGRSWRGCGADDSAVLRPRRAGRLVWFTKILTDPFHDVMLYYKAPLQLLRGEWIDPIVTHEAV